MINRAQRNVSAFLTEYPSRSLWRFGELTGEGNPPPIIDHSSSKEEPGEG